jgi:hypothetical protein
MLSILILLPDSINEERATTATCFYFCFQETTWYHAADYIFPTTEAEKSVCKTIYLIIHQMQTVPAP